MPKMTWQFPHNEFEETEGFTDAGITHFADNREVNLIRESIQNSLDARAGAAPVQVECSLIESSLSAFQGQRMRTILDRVVQSPHNDDKGRKQFERAKRLLDYNRQISTLCIKDSNTTGAVDVPRDGGNISQWQALTKGSGSPIKRQSNAAGSFGLGKHSAFAVADLRTVLYSTAWEDSNGRLNSRFIGKAILVSHVDAEGIPRRRTGYLSSGERNAPPFKDGNCPHAFRLTEPGTAIYILGYELPSNMGRPAWQRQAIATAIDNYFHAIVHRHLIVKVGDEEVNANNVREQYNALATGERQPRTMNFIILSKMRPIATERFRGIGEVSLRIQVHEDQKTKAREIALVRDSGMMITTRPADMGLGLGRIPPLWHGFTAVIECISEPGQSSYIRDSESPKHDKLSVDYIEDADRRGQARAALQELGQWVRREIEKVASLQAPESDDYVDELAKYLPVYDDDGKPGAGDPEKPATVSITGLKQSRNAGGGAGLLAGEHGGRRGKRRGGGTGGSGGAGGRGGGSGSTGNGRRPPRSPVSGIRVRRVQGQTHSVIATFDKPGQALSGVQLVAVGEDGAHYPLHIREAFSGDIPVEVSNGAISRLPDTDDARYQLRINTNEPVDGKTFRLVGRDASGKNGQGGEA